MQSLLWLLLAHPHILKARSVILMWNWHSYELKYCFKNNHKTDTYTSVTDEIVWHTAIVWLQLCWFITVWFSSLKRHTKSCQLKMSVYYFSFLCMAIKQIHLVKHWAQIPSGPAVTNALGTTKTKTTCISKCECRKKWRTFVLFSTENLKENKAT